MRMAMVRMVRRWMRLNRALWPLRPLRGWRGSHRGAGGVVRAQHRVRAGGTELMRHGAGGAKATAHCPCARQQALG
jgi:hypothetical protein